MYGVFWYFNAFKFQEISIQIKSYEKQISFSYRIVDYWFFIRDDTLHF